MKRETAYSHAQVTRALAIMTRSPTPVFGAATAWPFIPLAAIDEAATRLRRVERNMPRIHRIEDLRRRVAGMTAPSPPEYVA